MSTEQFIESMTVSEPSAPPPIDDQPAPYSNPRLELRCCGCGYGAISADLIRCPMCGDEAWDFAEWRPFSH